MFNKKINIFLIILICFIIFFVFFLINFKKNEKNINKKSILDNNNLISNNISGLKEDGELYKRAILKKNIKICKKIHNNKTKNLCFKKIAQDKMDLQVCKIIDDNFLKEKCNTQVILNKAITDLDIKLCEKISSIMAKKHCIEEIAKKINDPKECKKIKKEKLRPICLTQYFYKQSIDNKNISLCKKIPDFYYRANCLSILLNIAIDSDLDQDGLNFLNEIIYGTDFNNKDTDGDGFLDGDEIKNNYSPIGAKMLDNYDFNVFCSNIKNETLKNLCYSEFKDGFMSCNDISNFKNENLRAYCINIINN